ncbi:MULTISPECIES: hypothetical protein [Nostocales]|uniref:Uncharacterized protein n=3 Tax=Nostocales TaxID=1161 RepID=A0A0C1QR42_9CYAN|nr:hypothetical protein [Tolypothrix bouteillei]KAF3888505.1 hypothetical protein DA73_0400025775 [Tolypothrix bouteillei VB521301]
MLALKGKNITLIALALMAMAYFSTMSHLEIHPFLKGEFVLIPLQGLALIYVMYWRWYHRPIK